MMKRALKIVCTLGIVMIVLVSGGCSSSPSSSTYPATTDASAIRPYADPATETTLQGLSENNLAKYTQYGNAEFKAALTQGVLDKTATQISSQIGTYESKTFLRTEDQQGYIIVHYKAKYSKGEAGIRMVFDKDHLVAGQWFE